MGKWRVDTLLCKIHSLSLQNLFQNTNDLFKTRPIVLRKAPDIWTVDIQNTPNFAVCMDGQYNFGIGGAVAGDMSGKPVYIRYQLHLILCHRRAADTLAYGNADAGRFPWKGPSTRAPSIIL